MVKKSLQNLLFGALCFSSVALTAQTYTSQLSDTKVKKKFGHVLAERLIVNTDSTKNYFYRLDRENLYDQLDSIARHAQLEESWFYVPQSKLLFESGSNEEERSVSTTGKLLLDLVKKYDYIETYHPHNAFADSSSYGKIPNRDDMKNLIVQTIWATYRNKHARIKANHVSIQGITSVEVYNKDFIFLLAHKYIEENDSENYFELVELYADAAKNFVDKKLTTWGWGYKESPYLKEMLDIVEDEDEDFKVYVATQVPLDMVVGNGAKSSFLRVSFTPSKKYKKTQLEYRIQFTPNNALQNNESIPASNNKKED